MATYQIMRRDPATGATSRWSSNDYRRTVLAARYDHEQRGQHVTVTRTDSGNVVVFHGSNMAAEMKQSTYQQRPV
jgi:hypothetical protein